MAQIKVELTEDMVKLISNIRFQKFPEIKEDDKRMDIRAGLDFNSLYGGSYLFEDVAYILGLWDKHIEGTEEDPLGVEFPKDVEDYMWQTHGYILENIEYIEQIVHQFCGKGGITAGTYVTKSNEMIWKKK